MGLIRVRCKVQIGEKQLPLAQHLALAGLRFLDLHDHVGLREHIRGGCNDRRAGRDIVGIRETRTHTRAGFDQHRVAMRHGLHRCIGRHADAEFLRLDLFRASDFHWSLSLGV